MRVDIVADVRPVIDSLARFGAEVPYAINRTLVRTRDSATRPAAVEAVASDTGLAPLEIHSAMRTEDPTAENPVATLLVSGRRVPLIAFSAQETVSGVSYQLPTGRGFVPGGFIARMRSGHVGVFARRLPSVRRSRGAWGPNLPIVEQRGPSVGRVVEQRPAVVEAITQRTVEALPVFLDQEIAALARATDLAPS